MIVDRQAVVLVLDDDPNVGAFVRATLPEKTEFINASEDGVSMPMNTYMKFASTMAASNSFLSERSMDASV